MDCDRFLFIGRGVINGLFLVKHFILNVNNHRKSDEENQNENWRYRSHVTRS